jgi:hypothetical protein
MPSFVCILLPLNNCIMKQHSKHHWANDNDLNGLLFFTQRMDELLFDYSLDTYKFSALNTCFLCLEADRTIGFVEEGVIEARHQEHVLEELNWSFANDPVAKKLIGSSKDEYFPLIDFQNIKDVRIKVQILLNKLSPKKYVEELESQLYEAIRHNHKKDISDLAASYVTTLINIGYQKNIILYHLRKHFFDYKKVPVEQVDSVIAFFNVFSLAIHNYKVVFRSSKLLNEIKDSCTGFGMTISDDIELNSGMGKKFIADKVDNELFIVCDGIQALDGISAKIEASGKLKRVVNLFTYFHHKEVSHWSEDAIVIKDNTEYYINKQKSPMVKSADSRPKKAASDLRDVLQNFKMETRSWQKFNRAFDLHGLAVGGEEVENQILNTWIAFETMIDAKEIGSKIQHITNAVVPFINLFYIRNIFHYIYRSLKRWNRKKLFELLDTVPNDVAPTNIHKTAVLIVCEEFKDSRVELFSMLDDFPLLRFRMFQLNKALSSGKHVQDFIEGHTMKVKWHIRRIYRARNLIVHEGSIDRNIDILAENAHSYLDSFMNGMIYLAARKRDIMTINQGVKEGNIIYDYWQKTLKRLPDTRCDLSNYSMFLFGQSEFA